MIFFSRNLQKCLKSIHFTTRKWKKLIKISLEFVQNLSLVFHCYKLYFSRFILVKDHWMERDMALAEQFCQIVINTKENIEMVRDTAKAATCSIKMEHDTMASGKKA